MKSASGMQTCRSPTPSCLATTIAASGIGFKGATRFLPRHGQLDRMDVIHVPHCARDIAAILFL